MRFDLETLSIKSQKRTTIDTDAISRMIYDDGSLDFMDETYDEE
jgi:hypothetical protein